MNLRQFKMMKSNSQINSRYGKKKHVALSQSIVA